MIGPLRMRSVGIVCDEQEIPAPSPVRAGLQKRWGRCWQPPDGPLPPIQCWDNTSKVIDNGICSPNQQPSPIQNT
jgi:hypothetical protein